MDSLESYGIIKEKMKLVKRSYDVLRKKEMDLIEGFRFYNRFVGSVEIVKIDENTDTESLHKIYYKKYFLSAYMTENIKENIIHKVNRQSDQERINDFYRNKEKYRVEMEYI